MNRYNSKKNSFCFTLLVGFSMKTGLKNNIKHTHQSLMHNIIKISLFFAGKLIENNF
jgi:hypothetical protein